MTFGKLRNSYVQSEKGSALFVQRSNNNISLKNGQFFVGAGDVPLHFQAPGINMVLPSKALAIITVRRNKETRIALLDTGNSASVLVNVAYQKQGIGLKSADQLVVIPSTALTYAVGTKKVERAGQSVEDFHYATHKTRANVGDMLERNMLLNCRAIRLANAWPYKKLEHRYGSRLAGRQRFTSSLPNKPTESIVTISDAVVVPAVYVQPNVPNAWLSAHAVVTTITTGHYFLASGSILAHAKIALLVDTPHGSVMVQPDSVALISSQRAMTRVFNLHDQQENGVRAIAGERSLNLAPGNEVALMEGNEADINRIILSDDIGHKNMRIVQTADGRGMITGEFSMGDLLAYHPLLQRLRKSPDRLDRDLVESLIKTAASRATMVFGE